MTAPRQFPYRKLDRTMEAFVATELARGHAPMAVRDMVNALVTLSPDDIRHRLLRGVQIPARRHAWTNISGQPPINIEDVRRTYDRMRKSTSERMRSMNEARVNSLRFMRHEDEQRMFLAQQNPEAYENYATWRIGRTRRLADAGALFRSTADDTYAQEIQAVYPDRIF